MSVVLADVLKDIARTAVVDVFSTYGIRLRPRPEPAPTPALVEASAGGAAIVAAVVGFNATDFRGTTLLATTFDLAADARPPGQRAIVLSPNSASDWIFVRDWVGELCNQTMGRIKNKIGRYGIAFNVSPPASFSGSSLVFALPKSPTAQTFAFEAGTRSTRRRAR
jgi:hypothetical protein